jgi:hypothetical protein
LIARRRLTAYSWERSPSEDGGAECCFPCKRVWGWRRLGREANIQRSAAHSRHPVFAEGLREPFNFDSKLIDVGLTRVTTFPQQE